MDTITEEPVSAIKRLTLGDFKSGIHQALGTIVSELDTTASYRVLQDLVDIAEAHLMLKADIHCYQQQLHPGIEMTEKQAVALFHLKARWNNHVRVHYNDGVAIVTTCGMESPMTIGICKDGSTHS